MRCISTGKTTTTASSPTSAPETTNSSPSNTTRTHSACPWTKTTRELSASGPRRPVSGRTELPHPARTGNHHRRLTIASYGELVISSCRDDRADASRHATGIPDIHCTRPIADSFGAHTFPSDPGPEGDVPGLGSKEAHSAYWNRESKSLDAMASIVVGKEPQ